MDTRAAFLTIIVAGAASAVTTTVLQAQVDMSCPHRRVPLEGRNSPLDSVMFQIDGHDLKICYGRPSARGRTMIGGDLVPFDQVWRTGANEPTIIHATVPVSIAGIAVPAGTHSLYAVPGEHEWQIIVNRAIDQWGHERFYAGEVEAQEVARAPVPSSRNPDYVETFTIRVARDGADSTVLFEWENTRVTIPIAARD
jgi:hypothetical protein